MTMKLPNKMPKCNNGCGPMVEKDPKDLYQRRPEGKKKIYLVCPKCGFEKRLG